ncbi:hypothetical protein YC2023_011053 [Brassica napus]
MDRVWMVREIPLVGFACLILVLHDCLSLRLSSREPVGDVGKEKQGHQSTHVLENRLSLLKEDVENLFLDKCVVLGFVTAR